MQEIVAKTNVVRETGFLYFLDKQGNVARTKRAQKMVGGVYVADKRQEVLATPGVVREKGFLYFIDKNGDVGRAPMQRGRKRKV